MSIHLAMNDDNRMAIYNFCDVLIVFVTLFVQPYAYLRKLGNSVVPDKYHWPAVYYAPAIRQTFRENFQLIKKNG